MSEKYRIDKILREMGRVTDLDHILQQFKLSPMQLVALLDSSRAREYNKAGNRLSKLHARIIANRHSPFAVHKLCTLLENPKSDLWLKAALAILSIARINTPAKPQQKPQPKEDPPASTPLSPEDAQRLTIGLAEYFATQESPPL